MIKPVFGSDPAEQTRTDNRIGQHSWFVAGFQPGLVGSLLTQQGTDLIPVQHSPSAEAQIEYGGSTSVSIRVVSQNKISINACSERQSQINCARFFRIGEGRSRKVRIRLSLLSNNMHIGETGCVQDV